MNPMVSQYFNRYHCAPFNQKHTPVNLSNRKQLVKVNSTFFSRMKTLHGIAEESILDGLLFKIIFFHIF